MLSQDQELSLISPRVFLPLCRGCCRCQCNLSTRRPSLSPSGLRETAATSPTVQFRLSWAVRPQSIRAHQNCSLNCWHLPWACWKKKSTRRHHLFVLLSRHLWHVFFKVLAFWTELPTYFNISWYYSKFGKKRSLASVFFSVLPAVPGAPGERCSAGCDVVSQRNAGVDQCKGGGVHAGTVVAAVCLKNFNEDVDLRPRV